MLVAEVSMLLYP